METFQIVPNPIEVKVSGRQVEVEGLGLHLLCSLEEDYPSWRIREAVKRLVNTGRLRLVPTHLEPVLKHPACV